MDFVSSHLVVAGRYLVLPKVGVAVAHCLARGIIGRSVHESQFFTEMLNTSTYVCACRFIILPFKILDLSSQESEATVSQAVKEPTSPKGCASSVAPKGRMYRPNCDVFAR